MATETQQTQQPKTSPSVFSMIDRSKSAWFTWVDIADMNGGADMTVKIVDIRGGEAGHGKEKQKLAAVFLEGIRKPLGCRITNLKSLVAMYGTDKVADLKGKLITLYIASGVRNPRYKPGDPSEEPTCKAVRIRNKKPSPAQQFAVKYDHAVAITALNDATEASEVEAIRLALTGQKPPAEHHAEIKATVASALERIKAAEAAELARAKAAEEAVAQEVGAELEAAP